MVSSTISPKPSTWLMFKKSKKGEEANSGSEGWVGDYAEAENFMAVVDTGYGATASPFTGTPGCKWYLWSCSRTWGGTGC
jgi:hypothetical protein